MVLRCGAGFGAERIRVENAGMKHFCFLVKTYSGDLDRVLVLLESVAQHNRDAIDVVVCVPFNEIDLFSGKLEKFDIELISDESVCSELFDEKTIGFAPGYLNQQIIKLAFWELGTYEFYLCLDSDCCFIRDFYLHDFFYDSQTPYANLYEWEPHFLDHEYRRWVSTYKNNLEIIGAELGLNMSKIITCCGCAIFSRTILTSFKSDFLEPNHYSYKTILKKCPFEFSWYNLWLIKSNLQQVVPVGGFFKVFHYKKQYNEARRKAVTKEYLAQMYVGVVLNSNWKPFKAPYHYQNPNWAQLTGYGLRRFARNVIDSAGKRLIAVVGKG